MSDEGSPVNDKVYIHEYIDIIGHNRGRYMYHMTANWSPAAQEDRHQLCYGVWGVVGSTGRWPQVVNLWEEDGFDGLARSFGHELGHRDLQDPKLAAWWATAAELRAGGLDRLLVPAPWMPTIEQACAAGIRGEVYAHEQIAVPRGSSAQYLDFVRRDVVPVMRDFGWVLAGAWETALVDDDECFLLWAIPTWQEWADREKARRDHQKLVALEAQNLALTDRTSRILLVEAALSPMRLGRQPSRADRSEEWDG
jgi:hypothetical protein